MTKGLGSMTEQCLRITGRVGRFARSLLRQLPERPYPSEHPWSRHHGGTPVG
jgi:hypothetical protein